jgi:hypothetical protein
LRSIRLIIVLQRERTGDVDVFVYADIYRLDRIMPHLHGPMMYGNIRGEYPESDGRVRNRTAATSAITSAIAATEKQHIARVARVSGVSGTHHERSFARNRLIQTTKGSCLIWREGCTKIRSSTLGDVHDGLFEITFEFTGDARIRFPHFKLDSTLLLEMFNRWH